MIKPEPRTEYKSVNNLIPLATSFTASRGISQQTFQKFKVWTVGNDQYYPYFDKKGHHVSNKIRQVNVKGFMSNGDYSKGTLFGQELFPAGSAKQITLVEGELDALSAYEMQGSEFPTVSVKSIATAEKDVAENFEYLNSFGKIVICFDKDEPHKKPNGDIWYPGQDAALRVASMFELGKVRILTLQDGKDANDYIQKGWGKKFLKEWWGAKDYTPAGLRMAKDLWEEVKAENKSETVLYPWDGLNQLTYGMRLSEIVLITADTGVGKTSVVKEIEHHLLKNTDKGIGILHLEEPNKDTLLGLMSITANRPLHLPDVRENIKEEDLRKYFDNTCNTDKIVVWDHFGSNSVASVLATIRHMNALGCKYIVLDHLSIVVSDQNGDERKQLDEISTKLKTLCMELNCCIICVIHINRQGQVRGSAGPEQIANIVIRLVRDKLADNEDVRNTTKISVEKNRFCGRTGPAALLRYDGETGRLTELPKELWSKIDSKDNEEEDKW